jgi:hypothetical protein
VTILHHLQHQPRWNRQRRDQGNVDATPDHHDRHGEAENAEHRHVLQQRQHIGGGKKSWKKDSEQDKKHRKNRKYDSLLSEPSDSHPDYSCCLFCRGCSPALTANASRTGIAAATAGLSA